VTLYERILTCLIIYRYAISTFLTLFVKYVFEKKYKFYVERIIQVKITSQFKETKLIFCLEKQQNLLNR